MVSLSRKPALGMGLYTPAQAARLARIPTQTMSRWIHGSASGRPAVRPQIEGDKRRTVTFLDLVQAMAIRAIRRERRVPLPKIRAFVDHAKKKYGIEYPFAREHTTYLFDDEIVLRIDDHLIQLTGKYKDQDLIRPVVELYMRSLSFEGGLASSYRPMEEAGSYILIDPHRRMGHPLVMPCGNSVAALVQSVRVEGSAEAAAEAHMIKVEDVVLAQKYDDFVAGIVP